MQAGQRDLREVVAVLPGGAVQVDAVDREVLPAGEGAQCGAAFQIIQQGEIAGAVGDEVCCQRFAAFGEDGGEMALDEGFEQLGGTVALAGGVGRQGQGDEIGERFAI